MPPTRASAYGVPKRPFFYLLFLLVFLFGMWDPHAVFADDRERKGEFRFSASPLELSRYLSNLSDLSGRLEFFPQFFPRQERAALTAQASSSPAEASSTPVAASSTARGNEKGAAPVATSTGNADAQSVERPATTPIAAATNAPAAPNTGSEARTASSTSTTTPLGVASALDDPMLAGQYVPLAAPYHYGTTPFLTSTELLAVIGAGLIALFGGSALIRNASRLRRRAEREAERLAAGISRSTADDIARAHAVAKTKRLSGIIMIFAALGIFLGTAYGEHFRRDRPIVFSDRAMLSELWGDYKRIYVEPETGRTLDRQQENVTTSEGQSYTMLRAVWMDDRGTFDQSYGFAAEKLRRSDGLYSWLYGRRPDGTLGVLTRSGGHNSASDADTDIALALLFAYARWGDERYLTDAKKTIDAIWEHEVVTVKGTPYLSANNVEKTSKSARVLLNPSYFAPYAYRIFATVDNGHSWLSLVDSSYDIIEKSAAAPLNHEKSAGLPPNWVYIDRKTGALSAAADSDYGFDAMRIPWRLALDHAWFGESRAEAALEGFSLLRKEWESDGALDTVYAHDGTPVLPHESPAFYGGTIGYFKLADASNENDVYRRKLEVLYNPDNLGWREFMSYYDDNWAWFGMALALDALPNLTATLARGE